MTPPQRSMLEVCHFFTSGLPIPRQVMEAVGTAAGIRNSAVVIDYLLALGLVHDFGGNMVGANKVAGLLCKSADLTNVSQWSEVALVLLGTEWRIEGGGFPRDKRALQLCRLALAVQSPLPQVLDTLDHAAAAATIACYFYEDEVLQLIRESHHQEALRDKVASVVSSLKCTLIDLEMKLVKAKRPWL
jgi:hypothetical protein